MSYLTAKPSRDLVIAAHQEATRELWPKLASEFSACISALLRQEAGRGDEEQARQRLEALKPFPMLELDNEARHPAELIIAGKGIPEKYPEDALHLAVAAANGIDIVVTWNFAHLNNPFTRLMIRQVVENAGYECPEVCSPDQLLESLP